MASTLPVGFMAAQLESLHIRKIFVMSEALEDSYLSFKRHKDASIEVVRVPEGLLAQACFFLRLLLQARLGGISVVIFHECCLPVLDLLLNLIKPHGYYLPQVTMSGFQEIEPEKFPKSKLGLFLKAFGLIGRFRLYRSPAIGNNGCEYVVSIKSYPPSISVMSVGFSREQVSKHHSRSSQKTNEILFITGKSFVSNATQCRVFGELIRSALAKSFVCHIKDHPNPAYRLDLHIEGAVAIDPLLPVELLETDYYLAVGVSSSALLGFNERAVSLINLLDDMSSDDRHFCVKHFEEALPGNRIRYVNSADEFRKLL